MCYQTLKNLNILMNEIFYCMYLGPSGKFHKISFSYDLFWKSLRNAKQTIGAL